MENFDLEKAKELRALGYKAKEIAEVLGCRPRYVTDAFRRNGLVFRTKYTSVTDKQAEEIASFYSKGIPSTEVGKMFGCDHGTVLRIARDAGIEIKKPTELYSYRGIEIDQMAFSDVQSEPAAYFYGWLLTDGNLNKDRVSIELAQKDIELLENMKEYLKSSNIIFKRSRLDKRTGNTYHQCSFGFSNAVILERLKALGMEPKKSVKEKVPAELRDNKHFWRGVIEGDGSLTKKGTVNLVGGEAMCLAFADYCKNILDVPHNSRIVDRGNLFAVNISGKGVAKKILDCLYTDAELKLSRKYKKYLELYYGND